MAYTCKICLVIAALLIGPLTADAGSTALLRPGTHALMRHATAPGTGDPENFRFGDCTTQRNLSDEGRRQARETGERLRSGDVRFTVVFTSQWCRTRETAELLALGPVRDEPPLNSFFADRGAGPGQAEGFRQLLAGLKGDEKAMLVTHQVNITALTGIVPASGEIVVVSVAPDGAVTVRERMTP